MTGGKVKAVLAELEAVCRKHNVMLVGTCEHEGIYGEITIHDRDDPGTWKGMDKKRQSLCPSNKGDYSVDTIGNEPIEG